MKIRFASILALTVFCCSCCSQKTSGITEQKINSSEVTQTKDSVAANNYRFIVDFYSIGEGVEGEQIKLFKNFITDYGKKIKKEIAFEESYWGREGETNICLKLSELSPTDQLNFITEAKNALKSARWVHFFEDSACRTGRKK